ncbi:hypothetical protein KHC28_00155 [Ancylobacter sonchi]|uniref:hypothetical protein n=1 Tax=Ancylobacter sonchi TaxID=1937790 RepID=UPI001BD45308|nr:hypothetical protein [Ancylobacter sonchi]MBS7532076.1 hypothetical protein [Ancylobacter sonchi]
MSTEISVATLLDGPEPGIRLTVRTSVGSMDEHITVCDLSADAAGLLFTALRGHLDRLSRLRDLNEKLGRVHAERDRLLADARGASR